MLPAMLFVQKKSAYKMLVKLARGLLSFSLQMKKFEMFGYKKVKNNEVRYKKLRHLVLL
jgi:hypothetical protein